jgi:hypothetical protein
LGLLIFGLLGRCFGSKAYGQENQYTSNSQNISMQIPKNGESYDMNQDQFRVDTLFNNKEGLDSGTRVNQNFTLGDSKQARSNLFLNNNLMSQTHDINQNIKVNRTNIQKQNNVIISDDSLSNISISPPSMKHVNNYSSNSEYSQNYRNQNVYSSRFNSRRGTYSRENRTTNTVKVDSDDEIYKQNEVIAALSISGVSYSDIERDDLSSIRKSVENNKKEFLKRQYYYDKGFSSEEQNNFEEEIAKRGWAQNGQYESNLRRDPNDNWGYSGKN